MSNDVDTSKRSPTVESIMAILEGVAKQVMEVSAELKEVATLQKEAEQRQKTADERLKATDAQLKETGVYLKKLGSELGNVGNQWGKIAEYLVGADFRAILKERFNIAVDFAARRFDGSYRGEDWEVDVAAANGEVAVVGEVKVTMTVEKIDKFVAKNLSNFHLYVPDHRHKKIYGLIAFVKIDEGYEETVLTRARKCGLLIVRAIGDTFKVLNPAGTKLRDYGVAKTR